MYLLAGGISRGQAWALVLLCLFLIVFIIVDIYFVLSLRKKNKKLLKNTNSVNAAETESCANSNQTKVKSEEAAESCTNGD